LNDKGEVQINFEANNFFVWDFVEDLEIKEITCYEYPHQKFVQAFKHSENLSYYLRIFDVTNNPELETELLRQI